MPRPIFTFHCCTTLQQKIKLELPAALLPDCVVLTRLPELDLLVPAWLAVFYAATSASWLNQVEIWFHILMRQVLDVASFERLRLPWLLDCC